jgi:hypothetical protein
MATIVLSAAGMALGGSLGGSVLGLGMATAGRWRHIGAGYRPTDHGGGQRRR